MEKLCKADVNTQDKSKIYLVDIYCQNEYSYLVENDFEVHTPKSQKYEEILEQAQDLDALILTSDIYFANSYYYKENSRGEKMIILIFKLRTNKGQDNNGQE